MVKSLFCCFLPYASLYHLSHCDFTDIIIIIIIIIIIQLVQMLGEGDELVPEHVVLQDKLQELQYKKQHMDHLVAEFQLSIIIPA